MKLRWLAFWLWSFCASAQAVTDCSRAASNVEKMLCTSQRAAIADQRMAVAFRGAFARSEDRDALRVDQARWQAEVRDHCIEIECLLKAYEERIAELDDRR